jgi:hypothetical protein
VLPSPCYLCLCQGQAACPEKLCDGYRARPLLGDFIIVLIILLLLDSTHHACATGQVLGQSFTCMISSIHNNSTRQGLLPASLRELYLLSTEAVHPLRPHHEALHSPIIGCFFYSEGRIMSVCRVKSPEYSA